MTTVIETRDEPGPTARGQSVPNNLPIQLTSFVGRRSELLEVREHLSRARLVTLTGPGGAGKTRLAIEIANSELTESFSGGVWWVDLSEVSSGAAVADAAAGAIGVLVEPVRGALRSLTHHFAARRALICLDNAEHLLADVAQVTDTILRDCPEVRLLVTSREPLGLAGEAVWRVPPLADDEAIELRRRK
jgi:predicted ATPase